jgi:hypothetical protein
MVVNPCPERTTDYWTAARVAAAEPMRRTRDGETGDPTHRT